MISAEDYIRLRTTTKDTRRPVKIAKKTQTYLDTLRQRNILIETTTTTTQSTTTFRIVEEDGSKEGTATSDHPTAHLRPPESEDPEQQDRPRRGKIGNEHPRIEGVQLVTPVYGEFSPVMFDDEAYGSLNSSRLVIVDN